MPCATRVQAMSLTPDREGQEGNTLARLPSPLPHNRNNRTPLPISRTRKGYTPPASLPGDTAPHKCRAGVILVCIRALVPPRSAFERL